ncbi:hypothetical protein FB45DRAFT_1079921 [Roridomyces roridus]|uniref:Uncharacterized protein n=1 Tax=Roridomyces roridus TaxID=1738132 RepID=A0AAD7FMU4_9AGAR|nr:hypothetical protein FB45DRAFT_1079921 [Roridomyces roridus]
MFKLLSRYSERWVQLRIQMIADLAPHMESLRGCLPALRRLWVHWDHEDSSKAVDAIECFDTAPSLVDVGLDNISDFCTREYLLFPVEQLTCYRVCAPWSIHQEVLELAPNIVEASISWLNLPMRALLDKVQDLPRLRRLYVSNLKFLKYLRAPVLSEIAMILKDREDIEVFDAFVERSACALRRLCLNGLPDCELSAGILNAHRSITSLALITHSWPDPDYETLDSYLILLRAAAVHPQLEEIHLGVMTRSSVAPIDYALVLEMMQSRRDVLQSVAVFAAHVGCADSFHSSPGPVVQAKLDVFTKESGVELWMGSGPEIRERIHSWTYMTPTELDTLLEA